MGSLAPIVMSATTFAGSAQFAAASILDEDGAVAAAIAAAVLSNMRYAPIAISVAPLFRGPAWRRLLEAQLVVDESWAIANRGGGRFDRRTAARRGAHSLPGVGPGDGRSASVAGDLLGDPERLGLDAAFPALFLALLIPLLRTRASIAAALGGAAVALALVPVAPPGIPIVAAAGVCLIG